MVGLLIMSGCHDVDESGPPELGNFCHAIPDGTPCDDGNPCTEEDVCGNGVCLGRSLEEATGCDDENACTEEDMCDSGVCIGQPLDATSVCDDGNVCTEKDICTAGQCVGVPLDCEANPANCQSLGCSEKPVCSCPEPSSPCAIAVCDEVTGACSTAMAEDGATCDDGDACTSADVCGAGQCSGAPVVCEGEGPCQVPFCDESDGACRIKQLPNGTICDDGNVCSLGETCSFGECGGSTYAPDGTPCDDEDVCTIDDVCTAGLCKVEPLDCSGYGEGCLVGVCDSDNGGCVTAPGPDELACDDGDPCTTTESCKAGVCTGGTNVCQCKGEADGAACDDADPCTLDDACAEEACVGQVKDCSDLDSQCALGVCNEADGECAAAPNAEGTPCDDGNPCTVGDGCSLLVCEGLPKDCSELNAVCAVGQCDVATGECSAVLLANGTPCDDGEACTGQDGCSEGVCGGTTELCATCTGKAVGEACDDDDACTEDETCVEKGALLVCEGQSQACPEPPLCQVAWCDSASGSCQTSAGPDGPDCDDDNMCTTGDACAGGSCVGEAIDMCGAVVSDCEGEDTDNQPTQAWPIALAAEDEWTSSFVGMARVNVAGDEDWLSFEAKGGQRISVKTSPHCDSVLDTTVSVLRVTGVTGTSLVLEELAYVDNGPGSLWGAVEDVDVPADGTYLVRVGAWPSSGVGSYLVDVTVAWPEPCSVDADCGCAQLACQADGKCVAAMPGESEPNGTLQSTTPKPVPSAWLGTFFSADDVDWFAVELEAGVPVDISTSDYCDEGSDTAVSVYTASGQLLTTDQDSGAGVHALIDDFLPPETAAYYVLVSDEVVAGGTYVLSVEPGGCTDQAPCACADQTCGAQADPQLPKLCLPKITATESDTPASLVVDTRAHIELAGSSDVDLFEVQLDAGTWKLATESYCGSSVDTLLRVFGPNGQLVAEDDDSGDNFFASVTQWTTDEPVTLQLQVSVASGDGGDVVVNVSSAP